MSRDPSKLAEHGSWLMRWMRRRQERRLVYAHQRCECGALYAYDPAQKPRPTAWDCSDIILGLAIPTQRPGAVRHGDIMPFVFWSVKVCSRAWALEHRKEVR